MSIQKFLSSSILILTIVVSVAAKTAAESPIEAGNELYAQQKYELAIKEYQRVGRDSEEYATAVYNIGVCYYELWRTDDAIEFYRRAVMLRRGNYPRASFALGIALEAQDKFEEAKEAYTQTIRTSRDGSPWAKFKLGLLVANEGDLKAAARLFKEATTCSGDHVASSHNNLGVMLARMGRLTEAEAEFSIALRQSRGDFNEAVHNLKLCRSLLATAQNRDGVMNLKLSTF